MLGAAKTISRHDSEHIIVDQKKVIAEFNWNSAYEPYDYGCYWTSGAGADPFFEYAYGMARYNLIHNSTCITGTGKDSNTNASAPVSYGTGDANPGGINSYAQVTSTGGNIGTWGYGFNSASSSVRIPVDNTKPYTFSAFVKTNSSVGYNASIAVLFYDTTDTLVSNIVSPTTTAVTSAAGWVRLSLTIDESQIGPSDLYASPRVYFPGTRIDSANTVNGDYLRVSSPLFEATKSLMSYFNGSTLSAGSEGAWVGTASNSASILRYGRNKDRNTGDPIEYDFINEYVNDADATTYEADSTGYHNKYFSLYDCFMPNRPDSGIVHMRATRGPNSGQSNMLFEAQNTTRFYPADDDYQFKYWNSYTRRKASGTDVYIHVGATNSTGQLQDVAPYVVYEELYEPSATDEKDHLVINSIRFKCQTYAGTSIARKPLSFSIDILPPNSDIWVQAYNTTSASIPDSGTFQIWKNPSTGTWGTTEYNPTDLSSFDINNWSTSTAFQMARGVRLRMRSLTTPSTKKGGLPFELLELAPLTTLDITSKVKSIRVDKGFNSTAFGMPFGTMNADTGDVVIQNEDDIVDAINFTSNAAILGGMAKHGFIIKPYFLTTNEDSSVDQIPLKQMYCSNVTTNDKFEVSISLTDDITRLSDMQSPSLFLQNTTLKKALTAFFDGIGWSKYNFSNLSTYPDTNQNFKYFFCRPEDSAAQSLEELCKSAGATLYQDEYGVMMVKTRQELFGDKGAPVAIVSDEPAGATRVSTYDSRFKFKASNATEVIAKSNWLNTIHNIVAGGAANTAVPYNSGTTTTTQFKNQNCLVIKRTSGAITDYVAMSSGTSTSVANKVIGVAHANKPITITAQAKTRIGTASASIHITWYDKDKKYLGATAGVATNLSATSFTPVTVTASYSNTAVAYYGIRIQVNSFSALNVEAQFTELTFNTGVLANVQSYSVNTVDPITSGTITYNPRTVFRKAMNIKQQDEIDKKRIFSSARSVLWTPGQKEATTPQEALEQIDNGALGASILTKTLSENSQTIKNISLKGDQTEAEARATLEANSNLWITLEGQSANSIVNFQGYVSINGEVIRYDGREFMYRIGSTAKKATVRTPQEYQDLKNSNSGLTKLYPTGRLRIWTRLKQKRNGEWYVADTGRGQFGTSERDHRPDLDITNWIRRGAIKGNSGNAPAFKPTAQVAVKSIFGEKTYFGNLVVTGSTANATPEWSQVFVGSVVRNMKRNMRRFGTRVRIGAGKTSACSAGMVIGTTTGASANLKGWYYEIKTTEKAKTANNISFYELRMESGNLVKKTLWSGKKPIYPTSLNTLDNQIPQTADDENSKPIYDLEVSRTVISKGKWRFKLFLNGKLLKTVNYSVPSGIKFYSGAGVFVTANSVAAFENFWAATGDLSDFSASENSPVETEFSFDDMIDFGRESSAVDKEFLNRKRYHIFYEEFGSPVKEAKYFNAKFEKYPAVSSFISQRPKASERYAVTHIKSGTFGAEFLVRNLSKGLINIGSDPSGAQRPLAVYGTALQEQGERILGLKNVIRSTNNSYVIEKMKLARRRVGEEVAVDITGEFIGSAPHAEELAVFYADKLTDESLVIDAEIFGNPCYQLGDIVAGRFTEPMAQEWYEYVITGIAHEFTSGLSSSLTLRRLDKW